MTCVRCQGHMVSTICVTENLPITVWRCINCGHLADDVIVDNQRLSRLANVIPGIDTSSSRPAA